MAFSCNTKLDLLLAKWMSFDVRDFNITVCKEDQSDSGNELVLFFNMSACSIAAASHIDTWPFYLLTQSSCRGL